MKEYTELEKSLIRAIVSKDKFTFTNSFFIESNGIDWDVPLSEYMWAIARWIYESQTFELRYVPPRDMLQICMDDIKTWRE